MRAPRRTVQSFGVSSPLVPCHTYGALGISGTPLEVTHTITRRRSSAGANRIVPTDARRYVAPPWMTTPAALVG